MKTPIEKVFELTQYAPIGEGGRIEVAKKIDSIYKTSAEKQLLEEKLKWYKKLIMKLDRIQDDELGALEYRDEVESKIHDIIKELGREEIVQSEPKN